MSKRSRTFQPPTNTGGSPAAPGEAVSTTPAVGEGDPVPDGTLPPAGSVDTTHVVAAAAPAVQTSSTATSRSAARRRGSNTSVSAAPSFVERYRAIIIGAIAVVVVGATVAVVANMSSSSASAYQCATLLTPGPTDPIPTAAASPEPQPTQRLGFTTDDLGRGHVDTSTKVDYAYCPPASGQHYNVGGRAPLARQYYPPSAKLGPGNWIHNLEHGYAVLLYKGQPTAEIQQQLQDIMAEAALSPVSGTTCGYSKVIAVRFDDMDRGVNFAAVAWDRELLLDAFDKQALLTFVNQWQDGPQTPESGLC